MLARFMLVVLFLGGAAMVIAGIVMCVTATGSYIDEGPAWRMTVSGWIFGGVGVFLVILTTATATILALFQRSK